MIARAALSLAIAALVAGASSRAIARDPSGLYASSPHAAWFKSQHNSLGEWCCDEADGHAYFDGYTVNADGSVTLEDGHKIPAERVLKGANPTGHAVYWFLDRVDGRRDYCFALGAGS